ncbi:SHOCT domain-containing protein, partial [Lacticaseibacillus rhamnosus]
SNKIIDASNQFLLTKYGKIDKALPMEGQLNKLEFLRDRDILTDEEFENLKNQLLGRENKGSIGFSR